MSLIGGGHLAALDAAQLERDVLVVLELHALGRVLLGVHLAGRARLDAERLALQVLERLDAAVLLDEQRLVGVEVRRRERDLLLALGRDRHRRRGDVALARVEVLAGLDALERRVDDRLLDARAASPRGRSCRRRSRRSRRRCSNWNGWYGRCVQVVISPSLTRSTLSAAVPPVSCSSSSPQPASASAVAASAAATVVMPRLMSIPLPGSSVCPLALWQASSVEPAAKPDFRCT